MRFNPFLAGTALSILVLSGVAFAGANAHLFRSKAQEPIDPSCADCGMVISSDGRDVVTLLGDASRQPPRVYVRMSDGSLRSVPAGTNPDWKPGDRVRLRSAQPAG